MLQILQQNTSGSKFGVLLPILSMAVTWHRLRVGPADIYLTRKASFKDTLFIAMHQGEPPPCGIVFRIVLSLDVSTQTVFLYYMSVKYSLRDYLGILVSMLRTGCYVKQMKSIQFVNHSSVIHMRAHVNSSTIVNICWLIQTFKCQCWGFQVYFKSILVDSLKTKSDFFYLFSFIKMSTLHDGLHNESGLYVFLIFIGLAFMLILLISFIHCSKF